MTHPSISIIIPTLNAEKVLEKCLKSIRRQDYPKNKIQILIPDGGSTDKTVKIAKKYHGKIIKNTLKTTESGRALGLKRATGDLIASIDSDNILPNRNWIKQMIEPFSDKTIVGSEPISFTYRRKDPYLTRYFALLGMNDPICLFTGNYDRYSVLTGKWTNLNFKTTDQGNYIKVQLDHNPLPTIGANGTFLRRDMQVKTLSGERIFDIDTLADLVSQLGSVNFAKVKNGIIHTYVEDDIFKFFRKQKRRIDDMAYYKSKKIRTTNWEHLYFWRIVWFQLQCILIFPLIFQMVKGYIKKPDIAWLIHPVVCYSTLAIYLYGWVKGKIAPREYSRINWRQ